MSKPTFRPVAPYRPAPPVDNTETRYWTENYGSTVEALAQAANLEPEQVAFNLALTAGDYNDMSDDDVLATIINEELNG